MAERERQGMGQALCLKKVRHASPRGLAVLSQQLWCRHTRQG